MDYYRKCAVMLMLLLMIQYSNILLGHRYVACCYIGSGTYSGLDVSQRVMLQKLYFILIDF